MDRRSSGKCSTLDMNRHDERASQRESLLERFKRKLSVNSDITPEMVSYRGNKNVPGFRWLKYREGFSSAFVQYLIKEFQPVSVLDPFSGIGTVPLVAAANGLRATGIEIVPVGNMTGKAIAIVANDIQVHDLAGASNELIRYIESSSIPKLRHSYPHVKITESAFPPKTEVELAKAREFISCICNPNMQLLLNVACMSVLESISYTRKDGQYLRWDYRSGKNVRNRVPKRNIFSLTEALRIRLNEMINDIEPLKREYGYGKPEFITDSCLNHLRHLSDDYFDMVITSPPYANRYDYTRTYALELGWLGYDQEEFKELRQRMLSATVENMPKRAWLQEIYKDTTLLQSAMHVYDEQPALREIMEVLRQYRRELSNRHIIRMLEGYFFEMALIIGELSRVVRPGGTVIMVNDNVQYHGEELPVDLILSDYAEQFGFTCENIWVLPRRKGNSSQQMRRFGRREQRKCVYQWKRKNNATH